MSGFMVNTDDIPNYLAPLEYASKFKYSFAAVVMNEMETFDEDECDYGCDVDEYNFDMNVTNNIWVALAVSFIWHALAILFTYKLAWKIRA